MSDFIYTTNTLEILHKHNSKEVTKDVEFFSNPHKHTLDIKSFISMDLEEYIDNYILKKFVESILAKVSFDIKEKSYKLLAEYIKDKILEKYPSHSIIIEIKEDNNNGYIFHYDESGLNVLFG